jgi:dTDP-4-amino-4,6-dideoxygalactose transaminase
MSYKSWPLGQLPQEFQRPELEQIKKLGYKWKDPRDVVTMFEDKVAKFAGAKYGIAVDCCSHGLFLSLKFYKDVLKMKNEFIEIPAYTYCSVPMQIKHAGFTPKFEDIQWSGVYQLKPFDIWDGAVRWTKGMYKGGFHIVSFQLKKRIPIGRGGMILTDDPAAAEWFRKMTYDGRDLNIGYMEDDFQYCGYHYYMTPEDAARGIILMDQVPKKNLDSGNNRMYSDLSTKKVFYE